MSAAAGGKKDLSGYFLSPEKWQAAMDQLEAPDCTIAHVRLYHNQPSHTASLLKTLGHNTSVTHLDIYEVEGTGAEALGKYLSSSCCLKSLAIQHINDLEAASQLATGLAHNGSLAQLSLFDITNQSVLLKLLQGICMRPAPKLPQLHLTRCKVGPEAAAALAATQVQELELPNSNVHGEGLNTMLQGLHLVSLNLSATNLGSQSAMVISQLLSSSTSLLHLNLSDNRLGDEGACYLGQGLAFSPSLLDLDLSGCEIGSSGAHALASALKANASLHSLNLNGNQVSTNGFLALLGALECNRAVLKLQLEQNGIKGSDSPAEMAFQLKAPLQVLLLAHNQLGDAGAKLLVQALAPCTGLEQLDLSDCCISDAGVEALSGLLKSMPHITTLLLEHNRMHNMGAQKLLETALSSGSLHTFRADDNRLTDYSLKLQLKEATQLLSAKNSLSYEDSCGSGNLTSLLNSRPSGLRRAASAANSTLGNAQHARALGSHKHLQECTDEGHVAKYSSRKPVPMSVMVANVHSAASAPNMCSAAHAVPDYEMGRHDSWSMTERCSCTGSDSSLSPKSSIPVSPTYQATCYIQAAGPSLNGGLARSPAAPSKLQAVRKPRYKPLTAEQQMYFNDF